MMAVGAAPAGLDATVDGIPMSDVGLMVTGLGGHMLSLLSLIHI